MPHVIVKLWPGKLEAQKQQLAARITEAVTSVLGYGDESVSVAMQEIKSKGWAEKVYRPDILECPGVLYKKPGYTM
ncbi:MAG: tautomerase family protein [Alphaproteobacteria bacterium]|nr:tautomerase family protein [Alphaproteobacteria bacterium]